MQNRNTELLSERADYEPQYEKIYETDFRRHGTLNPPESEENNGAFRNSSHLRRKGLRKANLFLFPMPPHVLMNFRGSPPGCGDSIADF